MNVSMAGTGRGRREILEDRLGEGRGCSPPDMWVIQRKKQEASATASLITDGWKSIFVHICFLTGDSNSSTASR